MKVDSLYICPWSLNDPLCRSQSLAYLEGLTSSGYKIALVTLESGKYPLSKGAAENQRCALAEKNIFWHPVSWGLSGETARIRNIPRVLAHGVRLLLKYRPRLVHTRSSVPGFFGAILSSVGRAKFLYDADSLLSLEYLETGHVSKATFSYRFLTLSESLARRVADRIIVLTELLKRDYREKYAVDVPIEVIPCCVDTDRFNYQPEARQRVRQQLDIADEKLLVYVGKAGSRYLVQETFELLKEFRRLQPSARLLVLSNHDRDSFERIARGVGVSETDWLFRSVAGDAIADHLSAADVGVCLIRRMESERGSSPIKLAEYLSCGLPVIVTDGIGDLSEKVRKFAIGSVVKSLDAEGFARSVAEIAQLWTENEFSSRNECRRIIKEGYSLFGKGIPIYLRVYSQLIR